MINVDPLFGAIRFRRTFGIVGKGFWEATMVFRPTGKCIKVQIPGGRRGASEKQRAFFRELELRYSELVEQIRNLVVATPLNYYGSDFFGRILPELDWKDFELDSVGLPSFKTRVVPQWFVSYRYTPMTDTYSVTFENWTAVGAELDD